MPEQKDIQQALLDFHATITDKPNLSDNDLFKKFPEFSNDSKKLQAAKDYAATLESGKYKSTEDVNTKFPEFFQKSIEKNTPKKEVTGGEWEGSVGSIKETPIDLMARQAKGAKPSEAQPKTKILDLKQEQQGIDNVVQRRLKQKGIKFEKDDANFKKEKESVNQDIKDGNLVHTLNNKGEYDFTTESNPLKTLATGILDSFTSEVKSTKINMTSNTKELSSYLDKQRELEPDVQEKATGVLNWASKQISGLPKLIGIQVVGGPGAVAADAYWNTRAAKIQELYYKTKDKLIQQGVSEEDASQKAISQAISDAPLEAVPDAILNYALAKSGGVEKPALTASRTAFKNYAASPLKMYAKGYTASLAESGVKKAQGYDVKAEDAFNQANEKGTDFALMYLGMHVIMHPKTFSKTMIAAAKEYISNVPEEVRTSMINKYGEKGKDLDNSLKSYNDSKNKVKDYAPQDIMHNVAGLQEAIDKGQTKIEALSKDNTTPQFVLKSESEALDNLKKRQNDMLETGKGDEHEYDHIDGQPLKAEEVKPIEEVKSVKLTDLPDRAFAVGMPVKKYEDLKSKIQKEGFTQPIIIDKESGNVLDGQSRLLVAQSLGIKDVPSIYMDNPTRTDLNEKIKEFEKQYIPSQEVKPTEEKSKNEEFKPTEEEIKISETAAPEQRAQALKQTKESYGTQSSIEGVGEPAAPISEDVLSKPVKDIVKSAEPAEQSAFDKWRGDRYKSEDEFKSEYGKEHFKEFGETEEEYLRRKFCE